MKIVPVFLAVQWHVGICDKQCLCIQLQQYSGMSGLYCEQ